MTAIPSEEKLPLPKKHGSVPSYIKYRIWLGTSHLFGFYFLFYLIPFGYVTPWSLVPIFIMSIIIIMGFTVGAHRYFTHRSFKANLPLQIILMLLQTMTLQSKLFKWCRDHKIHHKYTDTDADPHNSRRGFWFSHIGWTMLPRHPEVDKAFKTVNLTDLANDPIVKFQSKYYVRLAILVGIVMPSLFMKWLYPDWSLMTRLSSIMARHLIVLHFTCLTASVSHMWGYKTYDKNICPTENSFVSILANGEGYHNYHHTFPWDYRASESGLKINLSTLIINFFAWIGWAWDLKTVNQKMLIDRVNRTGDGKHPLFDKNKKEQTEGKTEKNFKDR